MDAMYTNGGYGYSTMPYGGYGYGYPNYAPVVPNQMNLPRNIQALTDEEVNVLKNSRPANIINIAVDDKDVLRAMCTHKQNSQDVVQLVNDGSGDVWCPICQERWNPEQLNKEEVEELVNRLINQMQNAKWVGDLPVELTRQLFTLMPLLKKYPEIHAYAMDNFNKFSSQNPYVSAQDASVYGAYNSLFAPSYGAYMNPQMPYQPVNPQAQQPQMAQQGQGYYFQQNNVGQQVPQGQTPVGNPYVNPMQAPMGYDPNAVNQQFNQQAAMMMNGYGQPQYPMGYQPVAPNVQQPQAQQNAAPAATTTETQTETTTTKVDL